MLVCEIGRETEELKSIPMNQKRIASSPTQHYIRHPQQTPSLQSHPTVVLAGCPHGGPNSHFCLPQKHLSSFKTVFYEFIIYTLHGV